MPDCQGYEGAKGNTLCAVIGVRARFPSWKKKKRQHKATYPFCWRTDLTYFLPRGEKYLKEKDLPLVLPLKTIFGAVSERTPLVEQDVSA